MGTLLQEVLLERGVGLISVWVHHGGKAELDSLLAEDGDGEIGAVSLLVDILDLEPRLHRSEQARQVFRPKWKGDVGSSVRHHMEKMKCCCLSCGLGYH